MKQRTTVLSAGGEVTSAAMEKPLNTKFSLEISKYEQIKFGGGASKGCYYGIPG